MKLPYEAPSIQETPMIEIQKFYINRELEKGDKVFFEGKWCHYLMKNNNMESITLGDDQGNRYLSHPEFIYHCKVATSKRADAIPIMVEIFLRERG